MATKQHDDTPAPGTANREARGFLDLVKGAPPLDTQTAEQNREDLRQSFTPPANPTPIASIEITEIAGVPVRVYSDSEGEDQSCLVYLHGGGWVLGNAEETDSTARDLCAYSGATVVNVDYRLAPEHPFPAAFDDALAVTKALLTGSSGLSVNRRAVAIAGGNLAAATSLALRGESPTIVHQVLIYPTLDATRQRATEGYRDHSEGFFLTARDTEYLYAQYSAGESEDDPRAPPGQGEGSLGPAPATVITAECDPLRDDGEAYARNLDAAGNEVTSIRFNGQVHPFLSLEDMIRDTHAHGASSEASCARRSRSSRRSGSACQGRLYPAPRENEGTQPLMTCGSLTAFSPSTPNSRP